MRSSNPQPHERPRTGQANYFTCHDIITPNGITTTIYTERMILRGQIIRIGNQRYIVHYVSIHPGKPANVVIVRQRLRDKLMSYFWGVKR